MHQIDFLRGTDPLLTVEIDSGTSNSQTKKVMAENEIALAFTLHKYLDFRVGDWCIVYGEVYTVQRVPQVTRNSSLDWVYALTLQHESSYLKNAQFLNDLSESIFSEVLTPDQYIDLLITNANRTGKTFVKGQVAPAVAKLISFSKDNCYTALTKMAAAYETEFWLIGTTIHLTKMVRDTGYLFKQGRAKGAYDLTRTQIDDSNVVTRLYVWGSQKNLPYGYQNFSQYLRLPGVPGTQATVTNVNIASTGAYPGFMDVEFQWTAPAGATGVTIYYREAGTTDFLSQAGAATGLRTLVRIPLQIYDYYFVTNGGPNDGAQTAPVTVEGQATGLFPMPPSAYIEKNVDKYGVREDNYFDEDIFPHRTGNVTGVNATNIFEFTDTTMDFNLLDQRAPGLAPKASFLSGELAGYQFEIVDYDPDAKRFTIVKNKDETVYDVPSLVLHAGIGDEYTLIDLMMPDQYVVAAENELLLKAQSLLDLISEPQLSYSLTIDPKFLRDRGLQLKIGDLVWIQDVEMNVNRRMRVVSVVRSLVDEWDYKIEISDVVQGTKFTQLQTAVASNSAALASLQNSVGTNNTLQQNGFVGDVRIAQGTVQAKDLPADSSDGLVALYWNPVTGRIVHM